MESLLLYEIDPSETSKTLANNIIRCLEAQVPHESDLCNERRILILEATKLCLERIPRSQRPMAERKPAL